MVSGKHKQPPYRHSQSDVKTENITPSKICQEEATRSNQLETINSQAMSALVPTTPQRSKTFHGACGTMEMMFKNSRTRPISPIKSCSPAKPPFLAKDSNVTNFTGWDVDGRLDEFESQFKVMKETFEGTMSDRKVLEEAIDLAKHRGT